MYNQLPKEAINNPSALDDIFVEMHKAYEKTKTPMTRDQTRWSMSIMMAEDDEVSRMYDDFSKHFPFGGFFKRCCIFPIKFEKRLLVWLAVMHNEFGIGGMILVAYYVQWFSYRTLKIGWAMNGGIAPMQDTVTLSFICERCFPFGIFAKETVHEFWDKQKVAAKPDNLIDHPTACASFMSIERTEPINSSDHIF